MKKILGLAIVTVSVFLLGAGTAAAQQDKGEKPALNPLKNAYFGDLHVHTSYSLDSYILTNRNSPQEAYRFAKGEPITIVGGVRYRLKAPLDFVGVTDHSEFLGEWALCTDEKSPVYNSPVCQGVRSEDPKVANKAFTDVLLRTIGALGTPERLGEICGEDGSRCPERAKGVWQEEQRLANEFYEPGRFTTFIAYEWSTSYPGKRIGMNHRNVIFRGTKAPDYAWSSLDDKRPERLWEWLEQNCTGDCQVLAIPHNANWSWGQQLALQNSDGTSFTREGLTRRARTEPLIEIFQHKGNSECMTGLGTADEWCNFEVLWRPCTEGETSGCSQPVDFVRNSLKSGLVVEQQYGVNPFKYGIIASTDTHNGSPGGTEENQWPGHLGFADNTRQERLTPIATVGEVSLDVLLFNPGGLVAVWAEANTRESIFDAMKRRETFGTSGTRVRVRFFGGWSYPDDLPTRQDLVQQGYAGGVPMGGDLPVSPAGAKAPKFVVWATKDANSANLQRIQIIKGWADEGGKTYEQTYDVVCSDGLKPDPKTHRCPDNGARVSLADCSISTDRGAAELSTVWTDPAFDPLQRAFYYVRVLENPTCRWSTHDAIVLQQSPPADMPTTVQERAWSSPIWYMPAGAKRQ